MTLEDLENLFLNCNKVDVENGFVADVFWSAFSQQKIN